MPFGPARMAMRRCPCSNKCSIIASAPPRYQHPHERKTCAVDFPVNQDDWQALHRLRIQITAVIQVEKKQRIDSSLAEQSLDHPRPTATLADKRCQDIETTFSGHLVNSCKHVSVESAGDLWKNRAQSMGANSLPEAWSGVTRFKSKLVCSIHHPLAIPSVTHAELYAAGYGKPSQSMRWTVWLNDIMVTSGWPLRISIGAIA